MGKGDAAVEAFYKVTEELKRRNPMSPYFNFEYGHARGGTLDGRSDPGNLPLVPEGARP